jgi:hypothetical protein
MELLTYLKRLHDGEGMETGGDWSLDPRRSAVFIVLIRVGVASILGRQALRLVHQPCCGVPAGILMNLTLAAFPFLHLL